MYNRAKELYCDATIFVSWFFIVYLPKKNRNWKMAQGCRLSPTKSKIFNNETFRVEIFALAGT